MYLSLSAVDNFAICFQNQNISDTKLQSVVSVGRDPHNVGLFTRVCFDKAVHKKNYVSGVVAG